MTVPVSGEVFETPEVLGRLAGFLRELTEDRPAGEVFTAIAEQRDLPGHDERMDGVVDDRPLFEATWAGVTAGLPLPQAAWEAVVLPAIVAFSTRTNIKIHLELAANLWVKAETAPDVLAAGPGPAATRSPVDLEPDAAPSLAGHIPAIITTPAAAQPHRRRRPLVLLVVLAVVVATTAFVLWRALSSPAAGRPSALDNSTAAVVASAGSAPTTAPAAPPGADVPLPPVPSKVPAPSPTWTGPGPATAPGAPTGLGLIKVTTTSIAFDWQAPADPGTGGIAYYRITVDGQDAGWTTQTKTTVGGLAPATTYTITVLAVNNAGLTSPASSPLTATTAAPPVDASPTPAATPQLTVSPSGTIPLGDSFTISGTGWICQAPAQVEVQLNDKVVAVRSTDPQGNFTAPVSIHADPDGTYYANVLGGGGRVGVTAGANSVTVRCGTQSQTITITFT